MNIELHQLLTQKFCKYTDFASDFEIKLLDYTLDKIYPCGWDMHRYSKG